MAETLAIPQRPARRLTVRPRKKNHRRGVQKPRLQFAWTQAMSEAQWETYRSALDAVRSSGVDVLLGGGFALAIYTGRWRNTKDIDFYIRKSDREAAVAALTHAGFEDYYSVLPYDRKWIYRSTRDGVIVDIIWAMANQRAQVDQLWFDRATPISIRGEAIRVVPLEEFIWCKLYILQRDHCDWTDVLNAIHAAAALIDWRHLLARLEEDWPLLKALLSVYGWICPKRAQKLPGWLRRRLRLDAVQPSKTEERRRIRLLDSRGWFAAVLPPNKPLEV